VLVRSLPIASVANIRGTYGALPANQVILQQTFSRDGKHEVI
jgi:hypothetical protein